MMIWFDGGFFMAAVVTKNGKVVRTAPILKYMRGWTVDRAIAYGKKRRWRYGSIQ